MFFAPLRRSCDRTPAAPRASEPGGPVRHLGRRLIAAASLVTTASDTVQLDVRHPQDGATRRSLGSGAESAGDGDEATVGRIEPAGRALLELRARQA